MLATAAGSLNKNANLLLAAGARTDIRDYQGSSIKDWPRRGGHRELAERLETAPSNVTTPSARASSGIDFEEDVFVDVEFSDWFKTSFLDLRDDLAEAVDNGKQGILLFISASRCSYCKAFRDTSLADPALRERLTERFDLIGLEIFDDREMTTPDGREYRVEECVTLNRASYTPTLIFFGKGGRLLLRIVGYCPPDRFRQVLDYLAEEVYEHTALRDYIVASEEALRSEAATTIQDDLFELLPICSTAVECPPSGCCWSCSRPPNALPASVSIAGCCRTRRCAG